MDSLGNPDIIIEEYLAVPLVAGQGMFCLTVVLHAKGVALDDFNIRVT
jgi:hypothetical protein